MKPFSKSATTTRTRHALSLFLAVATAISLGRAYAATTLTWDANTTTTGAQDGGGTWSTSNSNWWDGTRDNPWDNSAGNSASFGVTSTGGTVGLGSNITVANIAFNTAASYTIAGGGGFSLTLTGATAFTGAGAGTYTDVISADLLGTNGFSLTNSGAASSVFTLALAGVNSGLSGSVTIGGTTATTGSAVLRVDSLTALGNISSITIGTATQPVADLSSLVLNTTAAVGSGQTVTIFGVGLNNGGAIQGATSETNIWNGNIVIGVSGARAGGGINGTLIINGVISEANANSAIVFSRNTGATTVLNAVNTYTGDTQIYGGSPTSTSTLVIGVDNAINSASDFSVLTTAATGNEVLDLNGHVLTLRALDTSSNQTSASTFLSITNNASTSSVLTIGDPNSGNTKTFSGSIKDGAIPGGMSLVKINANTQVLVGNNTYTGSTTVNAGTLQLGSGTVTGFSGSLGAMASANFILNGGTFVIDNTGANNNSGARIADTATFNINGGSFTYKGSDQASTNSSETIGNINIGPGLIPNGTGIPIIRLQYGSTNTATITANQITHTTGGDIALVDGLNLGEDSISTASVSRLLLNTKPFLIGNTPGQPAGINTGVTDTKIVPFLLGEVSATTGLSTASGTPNTFVTYNDTTGLRPLSLNEYATAVTTGSNVRLTMAGSSSGTVSINSLIMAETSSSTGLTISGTMTDASGELLFVTAGTVTGGTLDFGSAEGLITVNSGNTGQIGSRITGSNGVTLFGTGVLGVSGQNVFTGDFTVRGGTLVPQTSSTSSGGTLVSSPFGLGNLIFAGGQMRASTTPGANATIGNNVIFQADTTFGSSPNTLNFTGGVTIANGSRTITNASAGPLVFSGAIGDGGSGYGLTFAGTGTTTLAGNNTYTGATVIQNGEVIYSGSNANTAVTVGNSASLSTSATLRGSGTVGDVTAFGSGSASTSGAAVDPGNSTGVAGILNAHAISITNGAHLSFQIGGDVAGGESTTGYDQVISSGAVNLNGGDLSLTLLGTPTFSTSDILYLVINNGSAPVSGTLSSVSVNGTSMDPSDIVLDGQQFQLVYNANYAGIGSDGVANDVALVAVVPEPGSVVLMLGGLAAMGGFARLRRRSIRHTR